MNIEASLVVVQVVRFLLTMCCFVVVWCSIEASSALVVRQDWGLFAKATFVVSHATV